jgi:exopolysaccharide biosynthesis polyprenyl glycosylphosphotransferase
VASIPKNVITFQSYIRCFLSFRRIAYLLLAGDVFVLLLCFNLASFLRLGSWLDVMTWPLLWPPAFVLLTLYVFDTYAPERFVSGIWAVTRSITAVVVGGVLISLFIYLSGLWGQHAVFGRGIFAVALILFLPWVVVSRYYSANWARRYRQTTKWLVLGQGESVHQLYRDCRVSGTAAEFLALRADEPAVSGLPSTIGDLGDLDRMDLHNYAGVVLPKELTLDDMLAKRLMRFRMRGTRIYGLSDFYESFWQKVPVLHLHQGWFVFSQGFDLLHNPIGMRIKRMLDVVFASLGLIVALPLMLLLGLFIRLESPGPAIYRQERKGENGRIFVLYKLRSMYANRDAQDAKWTIRDDPRITRFGRLIRLFRLDELPQLINVIRGDMSFIGPRPEARELTELYEREIPFYDLRYLVKPGITGWAQVMYPYGSSVEDAREKLQYDLFYIKNYSLLLDLAIFLKTIRVVLFGKGR